MPVTVVLEGRGEVPCEVVGRARWLDADVDLETSVCVIRFGLVRVIPEGEDEPRWVAIERVNDGVRRTDPEPRVRGAAMRVSLGGVVHRSLVAACKAHGISTEAVRRRMRRRGMSVEDALTKPVRKWMDR